MTSHKLSPYIPYDNLILANRTGYPDIQGVDLNGYNLKISQFADDTALIARDYTSLKRALEWVRAHERATGGKTNEAKFQGIRMGSQMRQKPPWDVRKYNWIANDQYLTILGVPLGAPEALKPFWKKLADRVDAKVARLSPTARHMSIFGRTNIANFIVYGTPRYWVQTLAAPKWFHNRVQRAADKILWESPYTGRINKWVKYPQYPTHEADNATRTMGTGLLHWTAHVKALQAKWILNYLNARRAVWKHALDAWFCRTGLGRGAVLSTIPPKTLTRSIRGNPALPAFWKDALAHFRALRINRSLLSREGALSQPLWRNRHEPPPIT